MHLCIFSQGSLIVIIIRRTTIITQRILFHWRISKMLNQTDTMPASRSIWLDHGMLTLFCQLSTSQLSAHRLHSLSTNLVWSCFRSFLLSATILLKMFIFTDFLSLFSLSLRFLLVFGGYGNTRLMIRKRVQNYLIKEITLASVVSELRPLKVLIEVSKGKEVNRLTAVIDVMQWISNRFSFLATTSNRWSYSSSRR